MRKVIIMGAGGRDFHNFNVAYRDDPTVEVVAFTAAQIPGIDDRRYPASLAGPRYPNGIPIRPEHELHDLIKGEWADEVVLAYSDLAHEEVMHKASIVLAAGADFTLLGPKATMLESETPIVSVCAVRTGCGKSQTSRKVGQALLDAGLKVALVRHPMPYGDLEAMRVQRFATLEDIDASHPTVEEREEYEEPVRMGMIMYAGVDYQAILSSAQEEADVVIWDGGNNDFPFVRPDLHLVVADALRPDDAAGYHPGEAVLRMADVAVVSKVNTASREQVSRAVAAVARVNPRAPIVRAALAVRLDAPDLVRGRRVLVVEDGPTITHGSMPHGAGFVAATAGGAAGVIDPRPFAVGELATVFARHPHIGSVLPAIGYSPAQVEALRATIERSRAEVVVAATPVDLARLLGTSTPIVRARYEFEEAGEPTLASFVDRWLAGVGTSQRGEAAPASARDTGR